MPMLAFIDRHGVIRDQYQGIDAMLSGDVRSGAEHYLESGCAEGAK